MVNDKRYWYAYFSVKTNRDNMIKKIDDKAKMKQKFDFEADEDIDKRQREILVNWKDKTKMERMSFIQECLDAPRDKAYEYVSKRQIEIKQKMANVKGGMIDKVKAVTKIFDDDKKPNKKNK